MNDYDGKLSDGTMLEIKTAGKPGFIMGRSNQSQIALYRYMIGRDLKLSHVIVSQLDKMITRPDDSDKIFVIDNLTFLSERMLGKYIIDAGDTKHDFNPSRNPMANKNQSWKENHKGNLSKRNRRK